MNKRLVANELIRIAQSLKDLKRRAKVMYDGNYGAYHQNITIEEYTDPDTNEIRETLIDITYPPLCPTMSFEEDSKKAIDNLKIYQSELKKFLDGVTKSIKYLSNRN